MLHESVDTETADSRWVDRKVALLGGFEFLRLPVIHQRAREFLGMLRRQRLVGNRRHLAIHLDRRRKAHSKEQVGGFFAEHEAQQIVHEFYCLLSFHHPLLAKMRRRLPIESILVRRLAARFGGSHETMLNQFHQVLIQGLHAHVLSGLNR